jgi:glutathione S-transferase
MTADLPLLFSFRRCPYAMRARLALLVADRDVMLEEVSLAAKPPALLAASPKATVPVLVLADGRVIDESLDIMHWALAGHDPDGWRDRIDDTLIAANDRDFKYHLDRTKYPDRHGSDPAVHRAAALALLTVLEARLAAQPALAGERPGFTDAAIMPFVRQFAAIDRDWFARQPLPRLQHWLATQEASPLFAAAMLRLDKGERRRFNRAAAGWSAPAAAPAPAPPPPARRR